MSEDQIERHVERQTDIVDCDFMAGRLSFTEYDRQMQRINHWADRMYAACDNAAH